MSWRLQFYRRAGEPTLIQEEVDPLLTRLPRVTRDPEEGFPAHPEEPVRYRYANPISSVEWEFQFLEPEEDPETAPQPAAAFEATGLVLVLPSLSGPETAQEALPVAAEVAQTLQAQVQSPTSEVPGPVVVDRLIQEYREHCATTQETLTYARERSRRNLAIGTAFLVAGLLMLLLAALTLSRGGQRRTGGNGHPLQTERVRLALTRPVQQPHP